MKCGRNLLPPISNYYPLISEKYPVRIDLIFKALKNRVSKFIFKEDEMS
jgi:hypothetical protein